MLHIFGTAQTKSFSCLLHLRLQSKKKYSCLLILSTAYICILVARKWTQVSSVISRCQVWKIWRWRILHTSFTINEIDFSLLGYIGKNLHTPTDVRTFLKLRAANDVPCKCHPVPNDVLSPPCPSPSIGCLLLGIPL